MKRYTVSLFFATTFILHIFLLNEKLVFSKDDRDVPAEPTSVIKVKTDKKSTKAILNPIFPKETKLPFMPIIDFTNYATQKAAIEERTRKMWSLTSKPPASPTLKNININCLNQQEVIFILIYMGLSDHSILFK
jgi:hypothetical protein